VTAGAGVMLLAVLAVVVLGLTVAGASARKRGASTRAEAHLAISVTRTVVGRVPPGFLGLSIEYWAFGVSAGRNPSAVDPVFVQLLRNLEAGQTMVLRIGGGSTDNTWWPVKGHPRPPGVDYSVTPDRLAVMKSVARLANLKLLLGLNLAEDSPTLAGAEARAMLTKIGASRLYGLELGNEPELYGNLSFPWYRLNGVPVPARRPGYDVTDYMADVGRYSQKLPDKVPLAAPSSNAGEWLGSLSQLLDAEPRLKIVTLHRYPLQACYLAPTSPHYPTLANLLSPNSSTGQAAALAPDVVVAHLHRLPLRVDEMNTVSCGKPANFNYIFGMALWALDALFADARVGIDGVNIHTWPRAQYRLFAFERGKSGWEGFVDPEYYGLLMFSQAAPPGAELLNASSPNQAVRVWATRTRSGTARVVLINDDIAKAHVLSVRIAGKSDPASLERLLAPSVTASEGVTLGGQTFGKVTTTGQLRGEPDISIVARKRGAYVVSMPPASAALLTVR
jgi:hypothetical protein